MANKRAIEAASGAIMDAAISQALKRLEELAAKGAIDANQLDARRAQLQRQDRVAKLAAVSGYQSVLTC